ncbi:hypothetical protein GCM10025734_46080 [Kitasatospora paranensis]
MARGERELAHELVQGGHGGERGRPATTTSGITCGSLAMQSAMEKPENSTSTAQEYTTRRPSSAARRTERQQASHGPLTMIGHNCDMPSGSRGEATPWSGS